MADILQFPVQKKRAIEEFIDNEKLEVHHRCHGKTSTGYYLTMWLWLPKKELGRKCFFCHQVIKDDHEQFEKGDL